MRNETKRLLEQIHAANPTWGRKRLAAAAGVTPDTARWFLERIKQGVRPGPEPGPAEFVTDEATKDERVLSSRTARIKTLEDMLAEVKPDMDVWEVDRWVANKWEVGAKNADAELVVEPLWQVKVWLRRKTPAQRGLTEILNAIRDESPILPAIRYPKRTKTTPRRALEVSILDPHFGLLCSHPEADGPWDLELAAGMLRQATKSLLKLAEPYGPFEQIVVPFGNDWVHADDVFHRTTAGTLQPEAMAFHRVYRYAAGIAIEWVEDLRKVAPVHVLQIPGNHSRVSDYTMGMLIAARFHDCKEVTVDDSSRPYKFWRYGVNLIGFEHGHSIPRIRLASLMANEQRAVWDQTEYREWHLGDQHRKGSSKPITFEEQGVSVEYLPGLTAPDEWHTLKGYSHQKRGAMGFVYDFRAGPLARLQFNVSQYTHEALC